MSVAVGRRIYSYTAGRSSYTDPKIEGFTTILCLTKSTVYGCLSPYELRDERGFILENAWQVNIYVYLSLSMFTAHYFFLSFLHHISLGRYTTPFLQPAQK